MNSYVNRNREETEMRRLFNRYVEAERLAPVTRSYFFSYVK
ncbi:hypothetical protein [Succinimonas amylolytica]|nr:hypothetical protein [Succinimonas amylolytica]